MVMVPLPPVGEVNWNDPVITLFDTVPVYVKAPKFNGAVIDPVPLPLVPVMVPIPDPTLAAPKEKVIVFPAIVPDAVPD